MANADVPRGFTAVGTLSGAPVTGKLRVFDIDASGATIAVGDALKIEADGNVTIAATGTAVLGVAVGFGSSANIEFGDADGFDPENLNAPYKHTTGSAGKVLVCLADDVVFAVQTDDGSTTDPLRGVAYDFVATAVGSNTVSQMELDTQTVTNTDCRVVDVPYFNSANGTTNSGINDAGAVNAEVHVMFRDTVFAQQT